ncbi:alpha/beta hydrolase [Thiomicrorhabdus sp. 6S2-11]|uniref:Alpha/beta hydrolase n=1 Tax=Thiomicrorhabdus marina TaxID=2818442 RepID=A0ABS3Q7E8_9GAMM|nr:alpha/beta hydrolase [Thiomicrorhabdus marina]MBO1928192.1 alpha/beta hydrolase [Thiomicrorhabdus marina]
MQKKWLAPILGALFIAGASYLPSAQAADVKEVTQQQQGLTLNANLLMADGKGFSDEVVLLTHGTLTHKERSTYAALQKNLANNGISSLAINLSFGLDNRHGEYDCTVPHTHKHTDAMNEIGYWMDWLKQQGADKVTLMGHSRGGNQTAWFAAERDSDQIDKVVLIAPATGGQQKLDKSQQATLEKAQKMVADGKGDQMMKNTDFIYCKGSDVTAAAFADYYTVKPQFDTPTLLNDITKPVMVVIGTADDVVADLPEKIAPIADAGKITVLELEDADHFFLDFANEDLAAGAAEFIRGE